MAKEQPGESQRYGGLENTTTFGVAAKRARDNDEQLHTNQVCAAAKRAVPHISRDPWIKPHLCRVLLLRGSGLVFIYSHRHVFRHADHVLLRLSCAQAAAGWMHGPRLLEVKLICPAPDVVAQSCTAASAQNGLIILYFNDTMLL